LRCPLALSVGMEIGAGLLQIFERLLKFPPLGEDATDPRQRPHLQRFGSRRSGELQRLIERIQGCRSISSLLQRPAQHTQYLRPLRPAFRCVIQLQGLFKEGHRLLRFGQTGVDLSQLKEQAPFTDGLF
jgi:hypothetical protein